MVVEAQEAGGVKIVVSGPWLSVAGLLVISSQERKLGDKFASYLHERFKSTKKARQLTNN